MGFSAEWLALREPADHAARDSYLLRRAAEAAGTSPVILDLGCGTGSTVRALAPHLPADARWRLVDHDPALTERAADAAGGAETFLLDISDLDALPLEDVTLVTASALLDLVPEGWVAGLAERLRVPLYAALSYDGNMTWTPELPEDRLVTVAFNAHQRGDKGMGPALGPEAVMRSTEILASAGFSIETAKSAWRLGPQQAELQAALVEGIAAAAREAGCAEAETWGAARRDVVADAICEIGHGDILATPMNSGHRHG